MIREIMQMIDDFLEGDYNPLDFSYDLPNVINENAEEIEKENARFAEIVHDEIPDICADYERDADPEPMKKAIKEQRERLMTVMFQ